MQQAEGILIRRYLWSDTSFITTWLTPHAGKLRLMAKGARRPKSSFAGKVDLFYHAEIGYVSARGTSTLHTLSEVRLVAPFDAGSVPCANVFLLGYFAELVDLCTEGGNASPELFDLLLRAVEHLRKKPATARALGHFETELCRVLGIIEERKPALGVLAAYCGKVPESRAAAVQLLATQ